MFPPSRLFKWGIFLVLIAIIRVVAFPVIEPANRNDPGLALQFYKYSVLIWVPAAILLALSAILPLWARIVRWAEGG